MCFSRISRGFRNNNAAHRRPIIISHSTRLSARKFALIPRAWTLSLSTNGVRSIGRRLVNPEIAFRNTRSSNPPAVPPERQLSAAEEGRVNLMVLDLRTADGVIVIRRPILANVPQPLKSRFFKNSARVLDKRELLTEGKIPLDSNYFLILLFLRSLMCIYFLRGKFRDACMYC